MKRLLTAAAFCALATSAQAQDCEIDNGMNVCVIPEPRPCEPIDTYESPQHFADSMNGVVYVWEPTSPTTWVLGIMLYDGETMTGTMVFSVDQMSRTMCLMATGTPLKQGTAL